MRSRLDASPFLDLDNSFVKREDWLALEGSSYPPLASGAEVYESEASEGLEFVFGVRELAFGATRL